MAFPTAVNSQITDAVTQSNVKVIGEAPAIALGSLYQSLAHAAGIAAESLVTQQQNANSLSQALLTRCVQSLVGSAGN
ncbi:RebB family R body protein [Dyella sp.]|uniref:RebB family R body protein n=1 Tax=Dyella sp. TaxID=1869338 RepID=UPI002FDB2D12